MFLSKLAFVGTATGNKEIYLCDYDGYNLKQVTRDKSIALMPRWSPQGTSFSTTLTKREKGLLFI